MRLSTDTDGTRYLKNYGKNGTLYDAYAFSSNHIYQDGVTQYTPLQLGNTLGAELFTGVTTWTLSAGASTTSVTNPTSTGFDIDVTVADGTGANYPRVYNTQSINVSVLSGEYYFHSFDTLILSGALEISQIVLYDISFANLGSINVSIAADGNHYNIIPITASGTVAFVQYRFNSSTTGSMTISLTSFKKITLTSLSNTYYNPTTELLTKETTFTPIADSLGNVCHKQDNGFSHWVAWDTEPTTADIDAMNADHDLIGRVWTNSESLPSGLVAANMQHYYPGNEGNDGYQFPQDVTTALGADIITNGGFDTDTVWTKGTGVTIASGVATFTSVAAGSNGIYQNAGITAGKYYHIQYDILNYSSGNHTVWLGGMSAAASPSYTGNGTFGFILLASSAVNGNIILSTVTTSGTYDLDNVIVKEVSAAEIQNYTSNCRTNFLNVSHGPSNLKFTQDATGRLTGYVGDNLLAYNGDVRYENTNWIPGADSYTIELIQEFKNDGLYHLNGVIDAGGEKYIGESSTGVGRIIWHGTTILSSTPLTGLHHLIGVITATSVSLYVDNVLINTIAVTSSSAILPFFLGVSSNNGTPFSTNSLNGTQGYFKVHNSAFNSTEVATAYAAAKTIYPTIP